MKGNIYMEQQLSLYKIFNTVATTNNISHASKELYISQPAISKSIQKLEEILGVKLFLRTSRGVHLTEEGKQLFEYTKSAFETLAIGEATMKKNLELGIGHLKIGVSTTLCKYILLPYLQAFVSSYPHIKITIECQSTFHTLGLLEQNKLDIGLVGKPIGMKNLSFHILTEIEDIFVATESYVKNLFLREAKIASDSSIFSKDIFSMANLMLLDENNMTRLYIDDYFNKNKIETNQILQVSNMDLLIEFAKIGLGVSCVVKEFVNKELEQGILYEIPLENPLEKREIGFAFHTSATLSNTANKFLEFIYNSK